MSLWGTQSGLRRHQYSVPSSDPYSVTMEVGPSDYLYLLPYWCVNRKYRWTLSWWTTIGSGRRIPLDTSSSAATPRGRSYATGVTCSQTRADQSHSGTRYRKCRKRTNWAMSTLHQSGSAENWVRSSRPGRWKSFRSVCNSGRRRGPT